MHKARTLPGDTEEAAKEPSYPPIGYAWYVVGVLMLIYVISFIDRQILSLLVTAIERDLVVSDVMMGLLMGPSFAIFYTLFGIPLGRLADHRSRRGIIVAGVALWSLMTACCAVARNYAQLFLFRVGVGVGEAALSPAAYSLITDYFPRHKLATAISVYGMGIYLGSGLAFLLGGLVIQFVSGTETILLPFWGMIRPWQVVFLIVGLPGLFFSVIMFTVREPHRRGLAKKAAGVAPSGLPFKEVLNYIHSNKATFFCHNMGFALLAFAAYASLSWVPTFFVRAYGWTPQAVGQAYGLIIMICGSAGIVCGGNLADWLARRGRIDAKMRIGVLSALGCVPFSIAYPLAPSGTLAMACLAPLSFALALPFGAAPAAMQEVMPPNMRGQAAALYLFVVNLIGYGLGPPAVALFTDHVFHDKALIGNSLLIVGTISTVLAAVLLMLGLKPYRASMEHLRRWGDAQ